PSQQIARVSFHRTKFNAPGALHCLKNRCGWCCILGLMTRPALMSRDRFGRRTLFATAIGAAFSGGLRRARADPAIVRVGYLRWLEARQTVSLLDKSPPDNGLAGARLAMSDNDTTGRFMNQAFELSDTPVHPDDDPGVALSLLAEQGAKLVLSDLPADRL